jgi:hypothetical protein
MENNAATRILRIINALQGRPELIEKLEAALLQETTPRVLDRAELTAGVETLDQKSKAAAVGFGNVLPKEIGGSAIEQTGVTKEAQPELIKIAEQPKSFPRITKFVAEIEKIKNRPQPELIQVVNESADREFEGVKLKLKKTSDYKYWHGGRQGNEITVIETEGMFYADGTAFLTFEEAAKAYLAHSRKNEKEANNNKGQSYSSGDLI